jgi:hypothetical protein
VNLAENGFIKWLDWVKGKNLKPILSETQMVSELYRYGGTIDIYAELEGALCLIDLKTSDSGIWPEMRHQVAAYRQLLIENCHVVDQVRIVRLGKTEVSDIQVETVQNLDKHFEVFLAAKRIYELQKELKE